VDNLEADIGQVVELDRVLMIGSKAETILGRPLIPGAKVGGIHC
jgi:ribosomal protein L21